MEEEKIAIAVYELFCRPLSYLKSVARYVSAAVFGKYLIKNFQSCDVVLICPHSIRLARPSTLILWRRRQVRSKI